MVTNHFQNTNLIAVVWAANKHLIQACLFLLGICLSSTVSANSDRVLVSLVNALSGNPIKGMKVNLHERLNDDSEALLTTQTTDTQGRTAFLLDGLNQGRTYFLTARPYEKQTKSAEITAAGNFTFKIGHLQVKLINGATNEPWGGRTVHILRPQTDGSFKSIMTATSNPTGLLRLDPPNISKGAVYHISTSNSINGPWKPSKPLTQGSHEVTLLDNSPLTVSLVDAISNEPLTNIKILARERLQDGTSEWRATQTTDAQGKAMFELDGLGQGRTYFLATQPYDKWVSSTDLSSTGDFSFKVGKLKIKLINRMTGRAWANQPLELMRIKANGELKPVFLAQTGSKGLVHLDPFGIATDEEFVIKTKDPLTNTWTTSHAFGQGFHRIVMGHSDTQLTVKLLDSFSSQPLAGVDIHARERLANGGYAWKATNTTNLQGQAIFDLDGLGQGRKYFLAASPFSGTAYSENISNPGNFVFSVGAARVQLMNTDTGQPMAGRPIVALRKYPDGSTAGAFKGTTDNSGIARFDLDGFDQGEKYVFYTSNPFGNDKYYYSEVINQARPVTLSISRNEPSRLDRAPPTIQISDLINGSLVPPSGFQVSGYASDNIGVTTVSVFINDPVVGISYVAAQYDENSQRWVANISSSMITVGKTAILTVKASDAAYNTSKVNQNYNIVRDNYPPQIVIDSHNNGDAVSRSGFLLTGSVNDKTGVTALTATVYDSRQGRIIDQYPLDISSPSGRWALMVHHKNLNFDSQITTTLTAIDGEGNSASSVIHFDVDNSNDFNRHVINRTSFGTTPENLQDIQRLGSDAYIDQQLAPETIDDSNFESMTASFEPITKKELKLFQLQHVIHSRRQLLELMTWFWDNHFNTDLKKRGDLYPVSRELAENRAFRSNALGRFRDLVEISAKSPAMLIYLDSMHNAKWSPNENYARELMELHTLGVDGGYTQTDVEEVARAFTGWRAVDNEFVFDSKKHDSGEKVVLGHVISANRGIEDGEQVLDILAQHPSTARRVCKKLAILFISDTPPETLIIRCANTFLANTDSPNQIAEVVRIILTSYAFKDPRNYLVKVKTPLEFVADAVRTLDAKGDYKNLYLQLESIGMNLFEYPIPTGYADNGKTWVNSQSIQTRVRFVNQLARNSFNNDMVHVDLVNYFKDHGVETAEGIVGFLFDLAFDRKFTYLEWNTALNLLTEQGTIVFEIDAPGTEMRLQRLVGTILSFPGYQLQ